MSPPRSTWRRGVPCWLELASGDADGSAAFYAAVFGWAYDVVGRSDAPGAERRARAGAEGVRTASVRGQPVADLRCSTDALQDGRSTRTTGSGASSGWTVGFATDDVEASSRRAVHLGAALLSPIGDVPGRGRRAVVRDPWGARFALWQLEQGGGFGVVHRPGAYDWCDLFVPDAVAARTFYARLFGATTRPIDAEVAGTTDGFLVVDDRPVAAVFQRTDGTPAHWLPFFEVDDADAVAVACRTAGGHVLSRPADTPFGRIAHLIDPFGAPFGVNRVARSD